MKLTIEQKILCAISHLGIFAGFPIIAPLLVFFLTRDDYIKIQAKEALAFQILLVILLIICLRLTFALIGFILLILVAAIGIFLPIRAIYKLCQGFDYSYPVTGKFVRNSIACQEE